MRHLPKFPDSDGYIYANPGHGEGTSPADFVGMRIKIIQNKR
jgi:hypothetical protein